MPIENCGSGSEYLSADADKNGIINTAFAGGHRCSETIPKLTVALQTDEW